MAQFHLFRDLFILPGYTDMSVDDPQMELIIEKIFEPKYAEKYYDDTTTFRPRQGMAERYANRVINPDYYGVIEIRNIITGNIT